LATSPQARRFECAQLDLIHPNWVIPRDRGRWFDVKTFGWMMPGEIKIFEPDNIA
jgi:hypothetical protein